MISDTHSHLHFKAYDADREAVHARMAEFDVKTITVGTTMNTSREAVLYADLHPDTWASVGFHPDHVTNEHVDEGEGDVLAEPYDKDVLMNMASSSSRVLALGETGLDFHYFSEHITADELALMKENQRRVFFDHAEIASKLNKTVIVHSRDAGEEMLRALQEVRTKHPNIRMVVHAFNGTWKEAQAILDLGCWLGIGGIITFKPRKGVAPEDVLSSIVQKIPTERLLLETDAPWLAPVPVRGKRNEPAYVRHIAEYLVPILGLNYEEVCRMTTSNAQKCFNVAF